MADETPPQLISFSEAALLAPRDTLKLALDQKRLTLYRRGRTLLLARNDVLKLKDQPKQPDYSIIAERTS